MANDGGTLTPELEARLGQLVAATKACDIPMTLAVRRASRADPALTAMISPDQVDLVFAVILETKIQALPEEILHAARTSAGESLLHAVTDADAVDADPERAEDLAFLAPLVGTEDAGEEYDHAASEAAFEDMFDATIAKAVDDTLAVLEIPDDERAGIPVPAVMAGDFRAAMAETLRERICPAMRRSRSIMLLADSHNWSEDGDAPLKELLAEGETNNPIFFAWDDRWAEMRPPADPAKKGGKKKGKTGAGSLLDILPGKKKKQPAFLKGAAVRPGAADKAKEAKAFWADWKKRAEAAGYIAPKPADIALIQSLLRYDPGAILRAWDEVSHLYQQEFEPKKHQQEGREGSLRDALNKWHNRLPPHAGEFLAIKCFFAFPKCDAEFMRKYAVTHGSGDGARRRAAPYLMQFLDTLDG